MNEYQFKIEAEKLGFSLKDTAIERLNSFLELLIETNKHTNLTAITEIEEMRIKHLYDSLLIYALDEFKSATKIIDVGSGAGFPCIPLAICFPDKQFISLEATKKKIEFQQRVIEILKLNNIKSIWNRAELLAMESLYRESFDLAIARAVAASNVLAELTIPFVQTNRYIVFYKGKEVDQEVKLASNAIQQLGSKIKSIQNFNLPDNHGERNLIVIQKLIPTNITYPRSPGTPLKKPL